MLFYAGDTASFSLKEARRNPTIWHNPTRSNARGSFRAAFAPAMRKGDAFIEEKLCIGAKIARHLSLSPKETTEVGVD